MILSAEYKDQSRLEAAIERLKAAGAKAEDIALFSAKPVELTDGLLDRPGRMSLAAIVGALLIGGGFTAFMFWAQRDYPLITGGMPIVSPWPTGVVIFETTMAGAVFGIFLSFLMQGRFFRKAEIEPPEGPRDPEATVLRVRVEEERREEFEGLLAG